MPIRWQSSLMMLLSKLAPHSLRSLASFPKIKIYPWYRNVAMVFAVWTGVMYAMTCLVKWSQKTKTFTMFGGWSNPIVVSILVKSTCSNSKGVVTMMGCTGALVQVPSCQTHCSQLLITFYICVAILGHQNWSCIKYRVHCWPWSPASQWHPFMAATQCVVGTMYHKTSSNSPLGVWQWQRAPWQSVRFFCSERIVFLCSVFVSSTSRCFRSCILQLEIHPIVVLSIGSSCWVVTQSVTCRFTCASVAQPELQFPTLACVFLHQPPSLPDHEPLLFLSFPWWPHPGWTSQFLLPALMWLSSGCLWLHCPSFLVFIAKSESCRWLYPMVR